MILYYPAGSNYMIICVAFDYEKQLSIFMKEHAKKETRNEYMKYLIEKIKEKQFPIDEECDLEECYIQLTQALNDLLCEGFRKNSRPYTEIKEELTLTKKS